MMIEPGEVLTHAAAALESGGNDLTLEIADSASALCRKAGLHWTCRHSVAGELEEAATAAAFLALLRRHRGHQAEFGFFGEEEYWQVLRSWQDCGGRTLKECADLLRSGAAAVKGMEKVEEIIEEIKESTDEELAELEPVC